MWPQQSPIGGGTGHVVPLRLQGTGCDWFCAPGNSVRRCWRQVEWLWAVPVGRAAALCQALSSALSSVLVEPDVGDGLRWEVPALALAGTCHIWKREPVPCPRLCVEGQLPVRMGFLTQAQTSLPCSKVHAEFRGARGAPGWAGAAHVRTQGASAV